MDNNEAFEKWAKTAKINDLSLDYSLPLTTYKLTGNYSNSRTQAALAAWQAAQQQSAGEIAKYQDMFKCLAIDTNIEKSALKADNERLREALAKVTRACYGMYPPKYLEDALSATTSSLIEHDNEE